MRDVLSAEDRMRQLMAQRTPAKRLRMCSRMFAGAKTLMQAGMAVPIFRSISETRS